MSVTVEVADNYFGRRLNTDVWDNADGITKEQALSTAEGQIEMIPDIELIDDSYYNRAILEQALFLLRIGPEAQVRLDLQSQGVEQIDVEGGVRERYKIQHSNHYAPFVYAVMDKLERETAKNEKYVIGDLI